MQNQPIKKYLGSQYNMLGKISKEETGDWEKKKEAKQMQSSRHFCNAL